jgi:hypothetical protein
VYFDRCRKVHALAYLTSQGWEERFRDDKHEADFLQWLARLFRGLKKKDFLQHPEAPLWKTVGDYHKSDTIFARLCKVIEGHDLVTEILSRMSPSHRFKICRDVFLSCAYHNRIEAARYLVGKIGHPEIFALVRDETDEERAMREREEKEKERREREKEREKEREIEREEIEREERERERERQRGKKRERDDDDDDDDYERDDDDDDENDDDYITTNFFENDNNTEYYSDCDFF